MKARVTVTLKSGILDPQGKAIGRAEIARRGRRDQRAPGARCSTSRSRCATARTEAALKAAADKLLANTVIENYDVEMLR
jgi:phosphoribosylformylglycinamidine synthase